MRLSQATCSGARASATGAGLDGCRARIAHSLPAGLDECTAKDLAARERNLREDPRQRLVSGNAPSC